MERARRRRTGAAKIICGILILSFPLVLANPSNATFQTVYSVIKGIPGYFSSAIKFEDTVPESTDNDYWSMVLKASEHYEVSPSLVWAIISVSSKFDPKAKSPDGALGLMQLMPQTASEMGVKNPLNPEQNILGGTRYLRYLLDRFNGNVESAVAAYHAGPSLVERYHGVPPKKPVRQFVREVLKQAAR